MSFWDKVGSIAKRVAKDVYKDIQREQAKKNMNSCLLQLNLLIGSRKINN